MADITMCKAKDCPIKESCYRYTASVDKLRQSYFQIAPYDHKENNCEYYWEK